MGMPVYLGLDSRGSRPESRPCRNGRSPDFQPARVQRSRHRVPPESPWDQLQQVYSSNGTVPNLSKGLDVYSPRARRCSHDLADVPRDSIPACSPHAHAHETSNRARQLPSAELPTCRAGPSDRPSAALDRDHDLSGDDGDPLDRGRTTVRERELRAADRVDLGPTVGTL